jgi:hypothetical protein
MSNDRDYPNSGIMFRDNRKQSDRDRDYRGEADIDCPDCGARSTWWLSAWIKLGRNGKFLSLAFKKKDAAGHSARSATRQAHDEETPF